MKLRTTRWQQGNIFDLYYLQSEMNDKRQCIINYDAREAAKILHVSMTNTGGDNNYISDLDVVSGCCFFPLGCYFYNRTKHSVLYQLYLLYDINRLMTKMPLLHCRWRSGHKTPLLYVKKNPRRRKSTSHETKTEIMLPEIET